VLSIEIDISLHMGWATGGAGGGGWGAGRLVCTQKKEWMLVLLSLGDCHSSGMVADVHSTVLHPGCDAAKRLCKNSFNSLITDGDLCVWVF